MVIFDKKDESSKTIFIPSWLEAVEEGGWDENVPACQSCPTHAGLP